MIYLKIDNFIITQNQKIKELFESHVKGSKLAFEQQILSSKNTQNENIQNLYSEYTDTYSYNNKYYYNKYIKYKSKYLELKNNL